MIAKRIAKTGLKVGLWLAGAGFAALPHGAGAEPVSANSGPLGTAASVQSSAQTGAATLALKAGSDRFVFSDWQGPDLPVWTYIPAGIDAAVAPIAFIMHGARRNADEYRDQWIEEAEAGGFIVIAPEFSRSDFPGSRGYNLGAMTAKDTGEWRNEELWSFSAIEPMFDDVVARLGGTQTDYTIYGHSAGSQFVHRFLFFKPDARVARYLAANAGWYTFATLDTAFPFGLEGTPIDEAGLRAALAKNVVVVLGDQDTDSNHASLNRSGGAMRQGKHRFARGRAYFKAARDLAAKNGWEFGWSLRVVKGVAHSNSGMAKGTFDLIE